MQRKSIISLIVLGIICALSFLWLTQRSHLVAHEPPVSVLVSPKVKPVSVPLPVATESSDKQTVPLLPQDTWK